MTPPLIAVLDYGIGNLSSAQKALVRSGADARLTRDPGLARDAAGVVLPGVGAFGACMDALRAAQLEDVVYESVASQRPFMGICVGMQMLFTSSVESPGVAGLERVHVCGLRRTRPGFRPAGAIPSAEPERRAETLDLGRP